MTVDAYEYLRVAIVSGTFEPNERLVEADIVNALGVRRTAVRAALTRLVHEGLVEHERNRGAKVRRIQEGEAVEILEVRAALEGLLARKAAEHATDADIAEMRGILETTRKMHASGDLLKASEANVQLHASIARIASHRTAARVVSLLNSQMVRFQYRTLLRPGRPQDSAAEHEAVVEAISRRDPDAAEAAMRTHLQSVARTLMLP